MGIRISEMEEATTFGADDYVPIVTNGTNKKALGAKIKNFIAGFFVSKSGDTMSGDLNINSNNARTKYINPNMTLDTSANNGLSSDSSYGAYFTDKNGNAVGDVSMTTRSTGRNYAQLMARNKKTDGTAVTNYIDVIADKDGSSGYYVSNPAAFRSAVSAAKNSWTLLTNIKVTTNTSQQVNLDITGYSEFLYIFGTNTASNEINYARSYVMPGYGTRVNDNYYSTATYSYSSCARVSNVSSSSFTINIEEVTMGSPYQTNGLRFILMAR